MKGPLPTPCLTRRVGALFCLFCTNYGSCPHFTLIINDSTEHSCVSDLLTFVTKYSVPFFVSNTLGAS